LNLREGKQIGHRTKLDSEQLHNLYSSANTLKVFKSRSTRWAGDNAYMHTVLWWEKNEGKELLGMQEVD
jgi:hypothetical protein